MSDAAQVTTPRWFDVAILRVGPWAPIAALVLGAVGFASNWSDGDIRTGLFPSAMASAFVLLAICAQALLRSQPAAPRTVVVGGWWTTLALLGPAGFFAGVAVGALIGLDEETLGGLGILPVGSMAFGVVTLPIAATLFGAAARRHGSLPASTTTAIIVAGWTPPVLMIFGGLAAGTLESVGSAVLSATFALAWIVAGLGLRTVARPVADISP